ncbi:MAG: TRAP transporter small permease subunit [Desulfobacterota bacterium]|nr:TRAP transporter small permease subunit [Thermodesulfobacteriota bacterium]
MKKVYEYICKGEVFIIKVFLIVFVALIFVAACTRYMGYPINWSVDLAVCLFAWCTFLGADVAMRQNKLMSVDYFINKLPVKYKGLMEVVNLSIILLFLLTLIGFGAWLSYTTRFRQFQGIPGFSYTWVTISVPVGGALMVITTLLKLRGKIAGQATVSPSS